MDNKYKRISIVVAVLIGVVGIFTTLTGSAAEKNKKAEISFGIDATKPVIMPIDVEESGTYAAATSSESAAASILFSVLFFMTISVSSL